MSLQSILIQERHEHSQWADPSNCQNPMWKPFLAKWYFSVVDSVEKFDGNHGNFPRSIAYTAMKILDIYLSSCPIEFQENVQTDRQMYKMLAVCSLYIAMHRSRLPSNSCANNDGIFVAGKIMTVHIFLRMCNITQDVSIGDFTSTLQSIHAFLHPFNNCSWQRDATPLVSTHFFDAIEEFLTIEFPHLFEAKNDTLFIRAKAIMDHTIANVQFARCAPSLNAMAAFIVAMQDVDREVNTSLLTFYKLSGGYDLSCLRSIVLELRSIIEREERPQRQEEQMNERIVHVVPL